MAGSERLRTAPPSRIALLLAFFVIYVVWGSTYLAIRYAVETIPPLLVVAIRQGIAGSAIFAWVYWRGYRPTLREWRASLVLGILYFVISHGALHWAETIVPSGLTALLIASEPIWIAILSAVVLARGACDSEDDCWTGAGNRGRGAVDASGTGRWSRTNAAGLHRGRD